MAKMCKAIKKYWFTFLFIFAILSVSVFLIAEIFAAIKLDARLSNITRAASNLAAAINTVNTLASERQGVAFLSGTVKGAVIDVVETPLDAMPTESEIAELTAVTMVHIPENANNPNGIQIIYFIVPPGETDEPVDTLTVAFNSLELAINAQQYVFIIPPAIEYGVPNAYVDNTLIGQLGYDR